MVVGNLLSFWDSKFHQGLTLNLPGEYGFILGTAWHDSHLPKHHCHYHLPSQWDVFVIANVHLRGIGNVWSCANRKNTGFFREIHGNPLLFKAKKTGEMLKMLGLVISWMDGRCLDVGWSNISWIWSTNCTPENVGTLRSLPISNFSSLIMRMKNWKKVSSPKCPCSVSKIPATRRYSRISGSETAHEWAKSELVEFSW